MPVSLTPVAPADAIAALEARGKALVPSFRWQERYADEHARAFTVAKSVGFDILKDIFAGLEAALKEGTTPKQFSQELTPLLQAKGWWGRRSVLNPEGEMENVQLGSPRRLQLMFDVNMRVSYAAGHWASFERNRAARPFLRYVAIMDENTRPTHAQHHNLVLPIDHPHWKVWAPPCGWNCRCSLQSLSQRDVDRLVKQGVPLKFEPPTIAAFPWENKVTGEVRFVPEGIDPGWDYNPGQAGYMGSVNANLTDKVSRAPLPVMRAGIEERLASADFERFLRAPEGSMPIGILTDDLAQALGAAERARAVALSDDVMRRQLRDQPDLTAADYRRLPGIFADPALVLQDGDRSLLLLKKVGEQWWAAAARSTASGQGLYLENLRGITDAQLARLVGRTGTKVIVDRR
ncbi:phage minor head protein [Devosia sp.]|uniref:phage head morphogenesis protein n=1 Tax=Devosia sp. TaxID=1871048 RepID=UPI001AC38DA0|nr:phage minor head protein [Devosia sp.]MBN9334706.1 hypothetical protein [Devosia sp.]